MALPSHTLAALLAAALVAGCAADQGEFPSLARRDAERISGTLQPVKPEPQPAATAAAPNPELATRLDQLTAQARAAHAKFQAREAKARQLAGSASGAEVASEKWAVATVAIADLESARSEAMIALADLDGLHTTAVVEGLDSAPIATARETVAALVGTEDRVLAELRDTLKQ